MKQLPISLPQTPIGTATSGNPFAAGEFLKMGVYATAVPEPTAVVLIEAGAFLFWMSSPRVKRTTTTT